MIPHEDFTDRDETRYAILDYIEVFYNRQRFHQTPGYKTTIDYEMMKIT